MSVVKAIVRFPAGRKEVVADDTQLGARHRDAARWFLELVSYNWPDAYWAILDVDGRFRMTIIVAPEGVVAPDKQELCDALQEYEAQLDQYAVEAK